MASLRFPKVPRLAALLRIPEETAQKVREVLLCDYPREVRALVPDAEWCSWKYFSMYQLAALDHVLDGFGIESIQTENTMEYAEYVNQGDTYVPTVIFFRCEFFFTDLGTFVERARVKFR
jgi:hypothetical protein